MALSGTIYGSVTHQPSSSNPFSFYFTWSASQNVANNYSDVTVKTYWATKDTGWTFDTVGSRNASITINGETSSISKVFNCAPWTSNPFLIQTATTRVYHNSDGTKSISISVRANGHASSWGPSASTASSDDCTASTTITLNTIPRAASITAAPDFNDEENPTITYSNPAGNSVTSLQACISLTGATDDILYRDISKTGSSYTFNLTTSERNVLRKATTGSNSRKVKFYVRTVIGGETYHSPLEKNFSIINYTPTFPVNNIGYYDSNTSISNITGNSEMIVQNQSNLVVQYTAATPKKSASISTYYFKLNGVTKTSTSAGGTISFGKINSGSNITLTAWCVDSRGNSSGEVSKTIKCYEYYQPSFTSFNSYRANSDGNPNVNGKYLKNIYSTNYPSVGGKNKINVEFTYITGSTSKTTADSLVNLGEDSKTYSVYATITDSFGGSNSSSTITVFGSTRIFNVSKDGTGFAIGKMAEIPEGYPGIFECRWPAKFNGDVECVGEIDCDTITSDTISCNNSITSNTINCNNSITSNTISCDKITSDEISCGSITINQKTIFNLIYPVGSIYMSVNSTSPQTLFGGTWTRIEDTFLLAAGGTYKAGTTGGEATHKLTIEEMPSHNHYVPNIKYTDSDSGHAYAESWGGGEDNRAIYTGNTGGNAAHNNMPPYLSVYMWKRTA